MERGDKGIIAGKKYRAVVFDLFGTLVDNFSIKEYRQVLKDMTSILKVPEDDFGRAWRETFPERVNGAHATHQESIAIICRRLGVPVSKSQIERAAELRLDFTLRSLVPRPGTVATLTTLRERGYRTALVSDCSPETPAVWAKTAFVSLFDVTVFSCVAGMKKPDRRIYLIASEGLGVSPRDCLYIGDGSSRELTGALAAGMRPVMIRDPAETADTHYIEREDDWEGPRISLLKELLELLE
jgi:putative hydrolase of the HAD superfamily